MTSAEYLNGLPTKVPAEALEGMSTLFHFEIKGEDKVEEFTVSVDDGKLEVKEGFEGEAKCVVKAKEKHFVNVVTGETNAMMAVLTGKIKISNQGELIKYAKIFGLIK